jgi:DNA repair exonuclease SbcCD ATPase subunit
MSPIQAEPFSSDTEDPTVKTVSFACDGDVKASPLDIDPTLRPGPLVAGSHDNENRVGSPCSIIAGSLHSQGTPPEVQIDPIAARIQAIRDQQTKLRALEGVELSIITGDYNTSFSMPSDRESRDDNMDSYQHSSSDALVSKLIDQIGQLQKELFESKSTTRRLEADLKAAKESNEKASIEAKPVLKSEEEEKYLQKIKSAEEVAAKYEHEANENMLKAQELEAKLQEAMDSSMALAKSANDFKKKQGAQEDAKQDANKNLEKLSQEKEDTEASLRSQIISLSAEKLKLARKLKELNDRYAASAVKISAAEDTIRKMTTKMADQIPATKYEWEIHEYKRQVQDLQERLKKSSESSKVLINSVDTLKNERVTQQNTQKVLADKIAIISQNLRQLSQEKEEVESKLCCKIDSLTLQKEEVERQFQELSSRYAASSSKITSAEETVRKMALKQVNLKAEYEEALKAKDEENNAAKAAYASFEAQIEDMKVTEQRLKDEVLSLQASVQHTERDSQETAGVYANRIKVLKEERDRLKTNEALLTEKLTKVAKALDDLTMQQSQIFERAMEQQETIVETTIAQNKLLSAAKSEYRMLESEKKERERLAAALRRIEQDIDQSATEREHVVRDIISQSKTIQRAQKERLQLIEQVFDHRGKLSALIQEEITSLPESVASSAPELVEIKKRHAETFKELVYEREEIKEVDSAEMFDDIDSIGSEDTDDDPDNKSGGHDLKDLPWYDIISP